MMKSGKNPPKKLFSISLSKKEEVYNVLSSKLKQLIS